MLLKKNKMNTQKNKQDESIIQQKKEVISFMSFYEVKPITLK